MFDAQTLGALGLGAVYVGTVLEGETVLLIAALLIEQGAFSFGGVIAAGYLGAITGDLFCFWMGRKHGRYLLTRWPRLGGRVMLVAELLRKHRVIVTIGYRFVYGVRSAVPAALGMSGIDTKFFVLLDLCVALVWTLVITSLGRMFVRTMGLDNLLDRYQLVALVIVVLGVVFWMAGRYACRKMFAGVRRE